MWATALLNRGRESVTKRSFANFVDVVFPFKLLIYESHLSLSYVYVVGYYFASLKAIAKEKNKHI